MENASSEIRSEEDLVHILCRGVAHAEAFLLAERQKQCHTLTYGVTVRLGAPPPRAPSTPSPSAPFHKSIRSASYNHKTTLIAKAMGVVLTYCANGLIVYSDYPSIRKQ